MAKVTVRELEDEVVTRLNARAHGRLLEAELREILSRAAAAPSPRELKSIAERITALTPARRPQTDSTELIRADRDRDS
jgi:plasmid stability protein